MTSKDPGERKRLAQRRRAAWAAIAMLAVAGATPAFGDEGGVSFWLPGQFGSLASVPGAPGWSLGSVYYHASADASASKEFVIGGRIVAGVDARADLVFVAPSYTFRDPVLDGQLSLSVIGGYGRMRVSANASVTGPLGETQTLDENDTTRGGADLYPLATLKWNRGVHNFMAYTMADIPVGSYRAGRLANIGIGHGAIDAGGGYTYFDPQKGHEFSAVGGITYNFENSDTDYKNGIDSHVDWGASQFLSESTHIGLVGYFYYQLTGDSGSGAKLGDNKSRVNGVGPQAGYFFPFNRGKGYVNLKGYWEFDAARRPEGWNLWLSLLLPLSPPPK